MTPEQQILDAAFNNDVATMRRLLAEDPALVNCRGPHPCWGGEPAPLHVAVEWGNVEAVEALLDAGADINDRGELYGGWFPIYLALKRPEIAHRLVERGAEVDIFAAAGLGMTERAAVLLADHPGLVDQRGPNQTTPLHWAATMESARLLLDHGADPDATDEHGNPPERSTASRHPAVSRFLLERKGRKADIHLAAALGDLDRMADLLDADPSLLHRQTFRWDRTALFSGGMPLHIAAIQAQVEAARLLVARGAGVDASCLDGVRPLHYAAWKGSVEMARFLLDQGAEIDALDGSHNATPLAWAEFQRKPELAAFLRSRGARLRDR